MDRVGKQNESCIQLPRQGSKQHFVSFGLSGLGGNRESVNVSRSVYPAIIGDDDQDESELSDDLVDHKKKLFWAMLVPSIDIARRSGP